MIGQKQLTFEEAAMQSAEEAASLLIEKHKDYGPLNILNCPAGPEMGLIVRLHDKLARLTHLYQMGTEPSNESLQDTWMDIMNYGHIGLMLLDGTFELPLASEGHAA